MDEPLPADVDSRPDTVPPVIPVYMKIDLKATTVALKAAGFKRWWVEAAAKTSFQHKNVDIADKS